MTIEKLPSGSYRIKQMYEGKMYSITVKQKPTKKEAVQLLADKFNGIMTERTKKTFRNIAGEYIDSRSNVLSPRSIREYKLYIDRLPSWFSSTYASDITQSHIQQCVNELSQDKAPKTVRSLHGFISAVMGHYNPNLKLNTALPQRIKKEPYIPTAEDVKQILEYTKEHNPMFYVPIALASSCGMRRSEILALKVDDIKDGEIHIHSALVENENNEWVEKTTKTYSSTRTVPIKPDLEEYIKNQGYVYNGGAQSISNYLLRTEKDLGIQKFSLHKLRHFFASQLLTNGVPMKDVMLLGGWETDTTLKEVYAHAMNAKTKEGKLKISSELWKSIF